MCNNNNNTRCKEETSNEQDYHMAVFCSAFTWLCIEMMKANALLQFGSGWCIACGRSLELHTATHEHKLLNQQIATEIQEEGKRATLQRNHHLKSFTTDGEQGTRSSQLARAEDRLFSILLPHSLWRCWSLLIGGVSGRPEDRIFGGLMKSHIKYDSKIIFN